MNHNPFHHLGQIGFAAMGDGDGPDEIDISTEVQKEIDLAGALVADLLTHAKEGTPANLIEAAQQLLAALGLQQV